MTKPKTKEQSIINKEYAIIKKIGSEEAYNNVLCIVNFLKENKLSLGYTKGTTSSLFNNYKIGLSNINPLEYGLISERNYLQKPYAGYDLKPHNKHYFGILLDKESYRKTKDYLKENKFTKAILEFYNIDIAYDKRLDNIKIHKRYSFKELSKLSIEQNKSIHSIKDFNHYIDTRAFNRTADLKEYWSDEKINSYKELSNKYSFLKTNNFFNVIMFQEEWMRVVKKITGFSEYDVNLFRIALGKKIQLKEFEQRLKNKLVEKNIEGKQLKVINEILKSCVCYLPCKAHVASDSYIDLLSNKKTNKRKR